jgi:hypothetical protein
MYHKPHVERLFREAGDGFSPTRRNPVTGSRWVRGVDPVGPQMRDASRALKARDEFAMASPGMPPLPLSYASREDLKVGGLPHIVAWYARSLEARDYDFEGHPSFYDYACGVLASSYAPHFIKHDAELQRLFPPRTLHGLGPGLYWRPAKLPS